MQCSFGGGDVNAQWNYFLLLVCFSTLTEYWKGQSLRQCRKWGFTYREVPLAVRVLLSAMTLVACCWRRVPYGSCWSWLQLFSGFQGKLDQGPVTWETVPISAPWLGLVLSFFWPWMKTWGGWYCIRKLAVPRLTLKKVIVASVLLKEWDWEATSAFNDHIQQAINLRWWAANSESCVRPHSFQQERTGCQNSCGSFCFHS